MKLLRIWIKRKLGLDIRKYQLRKMNAFLKEHYKNKELVGVEIGVEFGEHALETLENLNMKKLYLIDPYCYYDGYKEGDLGIRTENIQSDSEIFANKLLKKYSDKVVWIRKISDEALEDIKEKVDFVYIDGNHEYDFVKNDIKNYSKLVKQDGIIGGHDFKSWEENGRSCLFGVIEAVRDCFDMDKVKIGGDWWTSIDAKRGKDE